MENAERPDDIKISIDEGILSSCPDCRLGCLLINDVKIVGSSSALSQEFLKLQNEVAKIYNIAELTNLL